MAHQDLYSDNFPEEITTLPPGAMPWSPEDKCCECVIYDFGSTPLNLDSHPTAPKPKGMPHWLRQRGAAPFAAGGASNWVRDPEDRNSFSTTVPGATIDLGPKVPTLPIPPIPWAATSVNPEGPGSGSPIGDGIVGQGYCLDFEIETTEKAYLLGLPYAAGPVWGGPSSYAIIFNATDHFVQHRQMGGGIQTPAFTRVTNETRWPSGRHRVIWWGSHCWIDGKRYSGLTLPGTSPWPVGNERMVCLLANGTGSTKISNLKIYQVGQKGCLAPMPCWWPYKPAHSLTVGWQWASVVPSLTDPPDAVKQAIVNARSGNFVFTWDHDLQAWVSYRNWGPWKTNPTFVGDPAYYGSYDMAVLTFGSKNGPSSFATGQPHNFISGNDLIYSGGRGPCGGGKGITIDFRIAGHPTLSPPTNPVYSWMREWYGDSPVYNDPTKMGMVASDIGGSQPIDYGDMYWPQPTGSGAQYLITDSFMSRTSVVPTYASFAATYADEE